MPQENSLIATAARAASLPFRLFGRRPFVAPQKAIILQPGPLRAVMLTTPLLTVLSRAYPRTRFDWLVTDEVREAVSGNRRVTELVPAGFSSLPAASWRQLAQLADLLRQEAYDCCFIPSRSSLLAGVAWRAQIPQRVGLHGSGRGFAHTLAVAAPPGELHRAALYLALADAIGIDTGPTSRLPVSFSPSDRHRTTVTQRLIDELDWLSDKPLIVMHPGTDGSELDPARQWPPERFVRLGNQLVRRTEGQLLLVGHERDRALAQAIVGMMAVPVGNWVGRVSLGEVGALAEIADLYVGLDAGTTHIAAAMECPTLAIFGDTNPVEWGPYSDVGHVSVLRHDRRERPLAGEHGVTVDEALETAVGLLSRVR